MDNKRFFHALAHANPALARDPSVLALLVEAVQTTRVLDLRNEAIKDIPSEIATLSDLNVFRLDGSSIIQLPPEIGQLHALEELEIVSPFHMATLPDTIDGLMNLKRLLLPTQYLVLPASMMALTQLEVMNLAGADTQHISFAGFQQLKVLRVRAIPQGLEQLEQLEVLVLNNTRLTTLPPSIASLKNLRRLALNHSQITTLPPEIGQLTNLEELWLIHTPLTALPPEIGMLTTLKKLILTQTHLTTLPPEIGQLQALEELYLNDTPLRTLPREVGALTALRELILHNTQVTALPREVGQLPRLEHLTVGTRAIPLPLPH